MLTVSDKQDGQKQLYVYEYIKYKYAMIDKIIIFRASEALCECIDRIMKERDIDKTSVIRLAIYVLCVWMGQAEIREMDLPRFIEALGNMAPEDMPAFGDVCDQLKAQKKCDIVKYGRYKYGYRPAARYQPGKGRG